MVSETELSVSPLDVRDTLANHLNRVQVAVLGITLLALAVRLIGLGARVAHQDEARVAYWALRFTETGVYEYRPIVHGPFLTIMNGHLFSLFGASDFTMRFVVALVGGLLPLIALLLRERLRDSETVALALLLAFNPLLLYYSRFYRNDVLLAGFMLVAFGFFVRAYDHRRPAYLYAGTAAFALAFTTKENALVYPVCWLGATVLLWDHRLFRYRASEHGLLGAVRERAQRTVAGLGRWWPHIALAVVEFFAIVVFFYAPRNTDRITEPSPPNPTVEPDVPGLYEALGNPTLLPALVEHATLGSWSDFTYQWGGGNESSYLDALEGLWPAMQEGAVVLLALAVLGFVVDRYADELPRDTVAFGGYWGFLSVLGYPIIVDNPFPWEVIHMIMPLAVPAAVGLALIGRLGVESVADSDAVSAIAVAMILLILVGQVGATVVGTSYLDSQSEDNELVQYAQSSSDMKPLLRGIQDISRTNQGIDVLFYGDHPPFEGDEFYAPHPDSHAVPPAGDGWFERLPFAWYLESYGVETESVQHAELLGKMDEKPPVAITFGKSNTCSKEYDNATDINQYMDDYRRYEVNRFLYNSGCHVSSIVVFVHEEAAREHSLPESASGE